MDDEYFAISLDQNDTIFEKLQFYWYITETDDTYWIECYFPQIKVSMIYRDYFTNFEDAYYYGKENWGLFSYNKKENTSD